MPGVEPAARDHLDAAGADLDDVEPIDREGLAARIACGDALVVDVRPTEEYAAGHIPGAASIPVDELPQRLDELPADVEIAGAGLVRRR